MEIKISKLCSHCNNDFDLKLIEHNGCVKASISNFEDCPHCNQRNDTWVKVEWPNLDITECIAYLIKNKNNLLTEHYNKLEELL